MTYVFEILTQRLNLFKPQAKALFALLNALMCFSGRATMRNTSRDMERGAQDDSADGRLKVLNFISSMSCSWWSIR